jgi:hypothetical protein
MNVQGRVDDGSFEMHEAAELEERVAKNVKVRLQHVREIDEHIYSISDT